MSSMKLKVRYSGKRKFIALATGQVSMLHKWKKLAYERCPACNVSYATSRVYYDQ